MESHPACGSFASANDSQLWLTKPDADQGAETLLDEDAADLVHADQDIVGPFDLRLQASAFADRLAHGVGGPGSEDHGTAHSGRWKELHRKKHTLA
jgi:hypothetical protein